MGIIYMELKARVTAVCPETESETTYDACHQCQVDQLPHGCWEAEDFMEYLTCLIEVEMHGEENIGEVRKMRLDRLRRKYDPEAFNECDAVCVRFWHKECCTGRDDGKCDRPDMYREMGDVIDAAFERRYEELYNQEG